VVPVKGAQIDCPARPAPPGRNVEPRRTGKQRRAERRRPQFVAIGSPVADSIGYGLGFNAYDLIGLGLGSTGLEARLGVQSRSEVGRIVSEAIWLVCPSIADAFVGSETSEGLEPLGEIVRLQEGG
jgi:hypothetical protein